MVTLTDDTEIAITAFRLVRIDNGRELLVRPMRACDAERFNRAWQDRGVPTRWEPAQAQALAG